MNRADFALIILLMMFQIQALTFGQPWSNARSLGFYALAITVMLFLKRGD